MVGLRCLGSCLETIENATIEDTIRLWSNASSWPSGAVPVEGEDVHVEPGWNMVLDIDTPKVKLLRINGRLTFLNTTNIHLQAKHIFIRAGELHIGSAEYPFQYNATITLYGEKSAETIVYTNAIEAGNKNIANIGTIRMYGKRRTQKMTRLLRVANKGDTQLYVETGLDFVRGDRLALLPTSYDPDAQDDVFVDSYDNGTGIATLNTSLNYYHWGASSSTADNYNGVDMRGEVLLLTRNVRIVGEDIESWGGQIVTSDSVEVDAAAGTIITRTGSTVMDSVEIYNCSQIDTFKAALRFESAATSYSSITNSAIHNGLAWGIYVKSSQNVYLKDNILFGFRPIGVGIDVSSNVTLDNNVIGKVEHRTTLETGVMAMDKEAGVSVCAYFGPSQCSSIQVTNNIVGGAVYAGFAAMGHECGDYTSNVFKYNVAHSIKGAKSGQGLLFYPDASSSTQTSSCFEASYFSAYKCYYNGAFAFFGGPKKVKLSHMTMIDNREGFGANVANSANEYEDLIVEINDNHVYGETESPDCPADGGFCLQVDKYGVTSSVAAFRGKPVHITSASALPP